MKLKTEIKIGLYICALFLCIFTVFVSTLIQIYITGLYTWSDISTNLILNIPNILIVVIIPFISIRDKSVDALILNCKLKYEKENGVNKL